jgi:hypothetical protein
MTVRTLKGFVITDEIAPRKNETRSSDIDEVLLSLKVGESFEIGRRNSTYTTRFNRAFPDRRVITNTMPNGNRRVFRVR